MFAVECLQASSSPLQVITGNFAGPSLLLVKELALELYTWSLDLSDNYFELFKVFEELTFFRVQSAAKVKLPDCDGVVVAGADTLRTFRFGLRRLDMLACFDLPEELHLGQTLKAFDTETGTVLGTAAIEEAFWLGKLDSLQVREAARVKIEGLLIDWDFCDSRALVLRHSSGAEYADVVSVSLSGDILAVHNLIYMVADVNVAPVNLAAVSSESFFVFLRNGDMLNISSEGRFIDSVAMEKLYSASCACPDGLYVLADDGSVFHVSKRGKVKLIEVCTQDSLLAYSDNLLITWSAVGNGMAFLLSDSLPHKHVISSHGPILDAFQTLEEEFVYACGIGSASTLRKVSKALDVIERVRMPGIGATATGIWALNGHLFVSYSAETKCIALDSYQEVEVAQWNFAVAATIEVGYLDHTFIQVTRSEIRGQDFHVNLLQAATAARVRDGVAYIALVNAQLCRLELSSSSPGVTISMEAELTALYVGGGKVYAGLITNKIFVYRNDFSDGQLLSIDLNSILNNSIPNDIIAQHGGFYVGTREGGLIFVLDKGDIGSVLAIGTEPVHLCSIGERVFAASSGAYVFHSKAMLPEPTYVNLKHTRHVCSLPEGFAALTSDLSLGVIAEEFDYHMTFETCKDFSATAKRIFSIGAFVMVLLEEDPAVAVTLDSSTFEEAERVELFPHAHYFSFGHTAQEDVFYVGGQLKDKGLLHLCRMFPSSIASTSTFVCPVRAVAPVGESLVVASGPQLFLMQVTETLQLQAVSSIRVLDDIVDLDVSEDSILVTQVTFGVLIYTVSGTALELSGRARLENQCLFSSIFWDKYIVCLSKEGELIVLDRSQMELTRLKQVAEIVLWEGGRKLLRTKDGMRVLALTMSGSVVALLKDQEGLAAARQSAALETCSSRLRQDFLTLRSPTSMSDLDFLKKCAVEAPN